MDAKIHVRLKGYRFRGPVAGGEMVFELLVTEPIPASVAQSLAEIFATEGKEVLLQVSDCNEMDLELEFNGTM